MKQVKQFGCMVSALVWALTAGYGTYAVAAEDGQQDHSAHGVTQQKQTVKAAAGAKTVPAESQAEMDHSQMDHGQMDHGAMQGNSAHVEMRDPHAYSGGYDFGMTPRLQLADEAYMLGMMANRLERVFTSHGTLTAYDVMLRAGKNYDRLVIKSEGEVDDGKLHEARSELLWGHAVATFWDAQLGVRQDSGVMPTRNWLAMGIQGLAPYWFEVDAAAYMGEQGQFGLRLGAEYELLLTQRLILQPRMDANYYAVSDSARGQGAGLNSLLAGVRLRYEIKREIAPYVGVEWSGKLGETADLARAGGAETSDTRWVAGMRFWY